MPAPGAKGGKAGKQSGILPNRLVNYQDNHTPQRVVAELAMAKTDRAIYSERQLEAQMADFWFNHFNVFAGKGAGSLDADFVRARHDPAARHGQVPRSAGGYGEKSGDAVLSG